MDTRDTTAAGCCRLGKGLHYRSAEWLRLAEAGCWSDCWPEIDRDGLITGRTIGDEPGFLNVGEEAMIAEAEARAGGWTIDEDDCLAEPPASIRWPTIRNRNYSDREDDLGRHVLEAIAAADRGCVDCDLIGTLDDLEQTLALHAESTLAEEMAACDDAEEAVEARLLQINAAFENN
jgi:hypothetical protein